MIVNQPKSRKNCIIIIKGITINDNCITASAAVFRPCKIIAGHVVKIISELEIKPYCAISLPPGQSKLTITTATKTYTILNIDKKHQFNPTLEARSDSINKL